MVKVLENLKELYAGEDILNKHLCIACVSGITALLTDQDLFVPVRLYYRNGALPFAGRNYRIAGDYNAAV